MVEVSQLATDIGKVISYLLLGMSIKYIDQAFDLKVFNKKIATLLAVPSAVLMGVLIVLDPPSASIFMAIALGVAAAGKIDNIAFRIGIGLLVLVPIFFSDIIQLMWAPFALLFLSALADEHGNDWSDTHRKNKRKNKHKIHHPVYDFIAYFFDHRSTMKVMVLILVFLGQISPVYFIAFLLFDLGYRMVELISFELKPYSLKNPYKMRKLRREAAAQLG